MHRNGAEHFVTKVTTNTWYRMVGDNAGQQSIMNNGYTCAQNLQTIQTRIFSTKNEITDTSSTPAKIYECTTYFVFLEIIGRDAF